MPDTQKRASASHLQELKNRLSARDWNILQFISRHHFATTIHIRRAFFTDHATPTAAARATVRTLDRLLGLRLINRLERRVGGIKHGSASFIWHLDAAGARILRADADDLRHRHHTPSIQFLDHTLAIVDAHLTLLEASNDHGFQVSAIEVETEAWRQHLGAAGQTEILKPDLFVTVSTEQFDDHWYVEIDRGTESIPVLLAKCRAYDAYRRSGRAQAERGVFPRVLWVLPTERRVERLQAALRANKDLPTHVFVATNHDSLADVIVAALADELPQTDRQGALS